MSHHIYFIPGLGIDKRIFYQLQINSANIHYLEWIEPLKKEAIEDYARRMLEQIRHEGNIVLIGYSFGGMMAIEMAKLKRVQQIILISSIQQKEELPKKFRFLKFLPLQLYNEKNQYKNRNRWRKYFGLVNDEDLSFFEEMLTTTSLDYKKWAIRQLLNWKNEFPLKAIAHIHGTNDLIFPAKRISSATYIEEGTHFMIVDKSQEVSQFINEVLEQLVID